MNNTFNLIVLIILGVILVVAVLIFGGILPGFDRDPGREAVDLEVWGPWPHDVAMRNLVLNFNDRYQAQFNLIYTAKDPDTLVDEYLSALARRRAPDLIFITQDFLVRYGDTLAPYDQNLVSLRWFRDTFIDGGEIFWLTNQGALALPVMIDPVVMYYNRDLYTNAGIVTPPRTWSQFLTASQALTQTDDQNRLELSGAAMGHFTNINRAKDILAMLILQSHNPIITRRADGSLQSVLAERLGQPTVPTEAAVGFFTQFADPRRATFSWSGAQPEAQTAFQIGALGQYFGLASEFTDIRRLNPNLNFDLTTVPQADEANHRTFGRFIGLAVVADSPARQAAGRAGQILATEYAGPLTQIVNLPPANRQLLALGHTDPIQTIFYRSAIISRGWLDPNPAQTNNIFGQMINTVNTRQRPIDEAVFQAHRQLSELLTE